MKVNLSKTVKNLCSNQNMTLKDLANKMGIASESLSRTLKGNPQLATLENIAKCLNVDVCDCFLHLQIIMLFLYVLLLCMMKLHTFLMI